MLAIAQHLDDLSESFLMSLFHNGKVRTMKANYTVNEGDLRIIRPFVYVREKHTREFAAQRHLPVITENCPACFEAPRERARIKWLLAQQEMQHPGVYDSLLRAMKPFLAIRNTAVESKLHLIPRLLELSEQTNSSSFDESPISTTKKRKCDASGGTPSCGIFPCAEDDA